MNSGGKFQFKVLKDGHTETRLVKWRDTDWKE